MGVCVCMCAHVHTCLPSRDTQRCGFVSLACSAGFASTNQFNPEKSLPVEFHCQSAVKYYTCSLPSRERPVFISWTQACIHAHTYTHTHTHIAHVTLACHKGNQVRIHEEVPERKKKSGFFEFSFPMDWNETSGPESLTCCFIIKEGWQKGRKGTLQTQRRARSIKSC